MSKEQYELSEKELQGIEKEGKDFSDQPVYSNGAGYSVSPRLYLRTGYIKGATTERIKAKKLLEALELWENNYGNISECRTKGQEAIDEYNK